MAPLHALPLPERFDTLINSNFSEPYDPETGECFNINGCRTIFGILWSCVSVVLICTWVAIHPDVPKVATHPLVMLYHNLELMFAALLSPELVILWAMRQWSYATRMIKKEPLLRHGWGKTHAFFILMRGLVVYEDGQYREIKFDPLSDKINCEGGRPNPEKCSLDDIISKGNLILSEPEVRDRSHADMFAKLVVLLQVTWFVVQVFARVAEGLALSELEVLALGFALLNFVTFFLWWSKPLRVQYPVRIFLEKEPTDPSSGKKKTWLGWIQGGIFALLAHIWNTNPKDLTPSEWISKLIMLPLYMGWRIFGICATMLDDDVADIWNLEISKILFSQPEGQEKATLRLYLPVYLIAFAFGAVHCIPWFFEFPTHIEQWCWRIAALIVLVAPIATAFVHIYGKALADQSGPLKKAVWFTAPFMFGLYAAARWTLLGLALLALRDLPQSALQTTQWTTFIPHIG